MNLDRRLLRQARRSRLALMLSLALGLTAGVLAVAGGGWVVLLAALHLLLRARR